MVSDLKSVSTHYDLSSSRTEHNYVYLFVKIKAIWDCSSQLLCKTGSGDLYNHAGFIVVWMGERHFRVMGCNENREFCSLYLMLLFIAAVSLLWTSLVGFSKNKVPEEGWGAGTSVVPPDSVSGIVSFYSSEGRAGLWMGWMPWGWVVWTSAKHQVPAGDNCLLGNTIISANKNCLHSHKQIRLGPCCLAHFCCGNILVWEKICLCVKQFWIKFLSLYNSWYGQNCTHVSCLPFRWELKYCWNRCWNHCSCWKQLLLGCCYLFSPASFVLTGLTELGLGGHIQ